MTETQVIIFLCLISIGLVTNAVAIYVALTQVDRTLDIEEELGFLRRLIWVRSNLSYTDVFRTIRGEYIGINRFNQTPYESALTT